MRYHFVWLIWSSAFLLPWIALYVVTPRLRVVMWRASLATSLFGITEPIFVPAYWLPPSLFDLAQRTRFDIESFIFSFAIGGIGAVLYNALTRRHFAPIAAGTRSEPLHRFHRAALFAPPVAFLPLAFLPWNSIYAAIAALTIGSAASVLCRPGLAKKTLTGGALFLGLYSVFMVALAVSAPGYIASVWNLPALSGVLIYDIPLEEFLFGAAFGLYWSGVYEHFTWSESVAHGDHRERGPSKSAHQNVATAAETFTPYSRGAQRERVSSWLKRGILPTCHRWISLRVHAGGALLCMRARLVRVRTGVRTPYPALRAASSAEATCFGKMAETTLLGG